MRALALGLVVVLLSATAAADKRITDMTPGYEREAQTCATQISGLEKVQSGGATLAPSLPPDDKTALDADLATLATGLVGVKEYCAEVTDLVVFLKANTTATYKSVEKSLDERDNKLRKLRKASKKTIDALQPITRTWIGKIAQAQAQKPDVVDKRTPGKFPSGRTVALPPLGEWKLSGTAGTDTAELNATMWKGSVETRAFTGATCEQQQRGLPNFDPGKTPALDGVDVAWWTQTSTPGNRPYIEQLCARNKTGGGWSGRIEINPSSNSSLGELRALALRMIAAQAAPRPAKTP